ncbi:MAG: LapA family protein [Nitrospirae bacterium]|nr:MAG: LapA family protein [Nitrospirota bacterium]
MIRALLVIVLLTLSMTFFLQNREEEAILHYFGTTSKPTPIYKPILSAFGAGLLIMGILLFPAWIKLRMELRRTRKALLLAEEELDRRALGSSRRPSVFQRADPAEDDDAP